MLNGQFILEGVATKDTLTVSEKFAVLNVKCVVGPRESFLFADLVAFNGKVAKLAAIKEGQTLKALVHPESHKGQKDGARWNVRFIIDEWVEDEA